MQEQIAHLRALLREAPADLALTASLAGLLAQSGQFDEARAMLEAAHDQHPHAQHPQEQAIAHNLAELYRNTGRADRAEPMLWALVRATPPYLPSVVSLIALLEQRLDGNLHAQLAQLYAFQGRLLHAQFRYGPAEQALRRAQAYAPHDPDIATRLIDMVRLMGRPSESVRMARERIAQNPHEVSAWNNLGCALVDLGQLEDAYACFERALALDPTATHVRHNRRSGAMLNRLYSPELSAQALFAMHRDWGTSAFPQLPQRPAQTYQDKGKGKDRRRCRVGFLSGDFRYHAMGHFVEPLLTHLDRERFDIFCYDTAPGQDPMAQRMRQLPLHWREVNALDDAALAETLRADGLDLLVDLIGHTQGTRLPALATRPAPVMAVWLGYPFSTGFAGFDYRVADAWTDPPETQALNTETLALLPGSQFCYRPYLDLPLNTALPADANGGRVTFGSRNAVRKINAEVVKLWAEILKAVPDSRLLLQASGLDDPAALGRLYGLFEAHGIGMQRLHLEGFSPQPDNIRSYERIDIALDTFPFNGGATTCDALWMGVPVVTLAGQASFARMGVSILSALGQSAWIADTREDYVAQAVALARDLPRLRALRQTQRAQMQASPLCDEAGFAQRFGDLLVQMAQDKTHNTGTP